MKTVYSLSIEQDLLVRFRKACDTNKIKPHMKVAQLLLAWLNDQEIATAELLKCADCGAEYSSKSATCPGCDLKKIKDRKQKIIDKEKEEANALKRIEIENDIQTIQRVIDRLIEDPDRKDEVAKYIKEIKDKRSELMDL